MAPRIPKTSLLRNRDEDGRYKKPTAQEQMLIDMLTVYYNDPRMGGDLPRGVDNREAIRKDAWSLAECVYYKLSDESDPCSVDSLEIITNAVCGRFGIPVDAPAQPRGRAEQVFFLDRNDNVWETCSPNDRDAVNFGPRGAACKVPRSAYRGYVEVGEEDDWRIVELRF
jgi:hypothetical protein